MIISNEPGFYKEGAFGIRIENLVLAHEEGGVIGFETLTLAPMDLSLVDFNLLDENEKSWLNEYHARVYETLAPLLDAPTKDWLKNKTARQ
jgi:Xaa-Pro aminopeptidase